MWKIGFPLHQHELSCLVISNAIHKSKYENEMVILRKMAGNYVGELLNPVRQFLYPVHLKSKISPKLS
jgi:hypothetical protein